MNSTLPPDMVPELRLELAAAGKLIAAIQELSLARDLKTVMGIVRRAARELTGADGATFVLKDGTYCYYADEDAISPLWKGGRFPMSACISGWVMMHREAVVIPDIYQDPRIPVEAYRPTFVKSLAMVPIRTAAPIAAIGNYWAHHHRATEHELNLLQALANSTSVAMENIEILLELERTVERRTVELRAANDELEEANRELEAFAYSASHDLRAPLRAIQGFASLVAEDGANRLTPASVGYLARVEQAANRMNTLVHDLLSLARVSKAPVQKKKVDVSQLVEEVVRDLTAADGARKVQIVIAAGAVASCDEGLVRIVLENLLANAWKFTAHTAEPRIEFGFEDRAGEREFFVRDNGAGFAPGDACKLFTPFQRLHSDAEFPGVGIGLATVRRIVTKHEGRVRAEGAVNEGAAFYFSLGGTAPAPGPSGLKRAAS